MFAVIIVAGGKGTRMNATLPKQFMELNAMPVLYYSLNAFYSTYPTIQIILVLAANQIETWMQLTEKYSIKIPHTIISGGEERYFSVKNGLKAVSDNCTLVGIHDAVRPLVNQNTITTCYNTAVQYNSAIPYVSSTDSVRLLSNQSSEIIDRNKVALIQTPQVFNFQQLLHAYNTVVFSTELTDDASVFEKSGKQITLVPGNRENIKITTPMDLLIAQLIIQNQK